jgi:uncharacterized protein YecA (UPF0149 family)
MEKINRNASCPCGSGKKYKNCCGANEAVSITQLLEREIDELQKQLIQFAFMYYGEEIEDDFAAFEDNIEIQLDDEQERDFFEMIHAIWFSLFEELDDGKTIIEKFIASEVGKLKRPKLRHILQSWANPRAIAGKVIKVEHSKLTVEDGFSGEQFDAIVTGAPVELESDSFFMGMIMPFEQNYVFFPAPFDLPDLRADLAFTFIGNSGMANGYDSPQEYLTDFFMEIMSELPMVGGLVEIGNLDWPAPIYEEVAEILKSKLESLEDVLPPVVDMGVVLWYSYCQKKQKRIQNPNNYAAALHYLLSNIAPMEKVYTQKELAQMYGVSVSSISTNSADLENTLTEEIEQIMGMGYSDEVGQPVQDGTVIEFPTKPRVIEPVPPQKLKKVSRRDEERSQELILEALHEEGPKRYKLADQALKLNPYCTDAYVILAEDEDYLDEAAMMFRRGMEVGEQALGKEFFKENKGHFWGLIETRPYMRAKAHYAEALYSLEDVDGAIQQFEELLELNPIDNQGVRDSLFVAYLDKEELVKARELMEKYDEEDTRAAYNKLLLELSENGFTVKAKKLFKEAKKANKFVPAYLTGKKRMPDELPDFYGFGDENEAIDYIGMHQHLWEKIKGLAEWMKK